MAKRKSGTGTLRLRKDGRWEGRVVIGYNDKGIPITKNVLAKTKLECKGKLEELILKTQKKDWKSYKENTSDLTFGEWVEIWFNLYSKPTIKENTIVCYEARIYNYILPNIGSIRIDQLTGADLQKFYNELKKKGLSNSYIRGCHTTCSQALEKAIKEGIISKNPSKGLTLPKKKSREMKILNEKQIQDLINQSRDENIYELMLIEMSTGLRRGEICGLKWIDLDIHTGSLQVRRQIIKPKSTTIVSELKTSTSNRTVILPRIVVQALLEYKIKNERSEWIFPAPSDISKPMDPSLVYKRSQRAMKRAGIEPIRFHDLRHTFATMSLENGMNIKSLSAYMGHSSSKTTIDVYSHITEQMKYVAAEKIEQSIGKNEEYNIRESNQAFVGAEKDLDGISEKLKENSKRKTRNPGTGCVHKIKDNLWEGSYSPKINGKKKKHNVYAHSEEECEIKLKELIEKIKNESMSI